MRSLFALGLIALLAFASSAFALSDAEYEKLKSTSTNFSYADGRLNKAWKDLSKKLKSEMKAEQQRWIKSGWDQEAKAYMAKGQSRDCAYALPALERAAGLEAAQYNSGLEYTGAAKADGFFLTDRDYSVYEACGAGSDS